MQRETALATLSNPSTAFVPVFGTHSRLLPEIVRRAGPAAVYSAEEFFSSRLRNDNTRTAYLIAVKQFLAWCEPRGLELARIAPDDVVQYFDGLRKTRSVSTRKQHLAALRHFFDGLVTRHAILLNPALSVPRERYERIEVKIPEITVDQARMLLKSIKVVEKIKRDGPDGGGVEEEQPSLVGLRDRAMLAILAYTSSRAGAVAKLRRGNFYHAADQGMLHFEEKGGRSREISVHHGLEQMIAAYIEAAGLREAPSDAPLFRAAQLTTGKLKTTAIHVNDICRMMKRRLKDASLPACLSPHSFRAALIADLLEQGVPVDEVQHMAGHADPRTTRLYGRRQNHGTRNIIERMSL